MPGPFSTSVALGSKVVMETVVSSSTILTIPVPGVPAKLEIGVAQDLCCPVKPAAGVGRADEIALIEAVHLSGHVLRTGKKGPGNLRPRAADVQGAEPAIEA